MSSIRAQKIFAWCALIIASIIISLGKPNGWDFFWYLGAGQLMHGTGDVGENFTALNQSWHNHEWLFHWILAINPDPGLYHLFLHIVLVLAILITLFFLLLKNSNHKPLIAAFLTIIAGIMMSSFFELRAQMVSYLFFIIMIGLLDSSLSEKKRAICIFILMLIWANVHGAFVLGIGLIALHRIILYISAKRDSQALLQDWWIAIVAALLAPLVNPYFYEVYVYPFKWIGNSLYKEYITEWTSMVKWDFQFYPYLIYTAVAALILYLSRPHKLFDFILFVLFAILPFSAVRHLPFYYILASYILSGSLCRLETRLTNTVEHSVLSGGTKWIVLSCAAIVFLSVNLYNNPVVRITDPIFRKYAYPTGALAFMRDNDLDGRIFNAYQWGGYLWVQGYDVFIDGRLDTLYPDDVFSEFTDAVTAKTDCRNVFDKWDMDIVLFDTVIDGKSPLLTSAVFGMNDWISLYQDPVVTLFAHIESLDKSFLEKWQTGTIPIPDEPMCQYAAGMSHLKNNGDFDTIKKYLERAIELDPGFPQPHLRLAKLYVSDGK